MRRCGGACGLATEGKIVALNIVMPFEHDSRAFGTGKVWIEETRARRPYHPNFTSAGLSISITTVILCVCPESSDLFDGAE